MTKDNYFDELDKLLENEYAGLAEGGTSADVVGFLDTGSYVLNALYSGSIFRGMPANKISALAGEESTGKTFFMLAILKNFLESNDRAVGIIFESEGSITKEIMASRGIDTKRVYIVPVETIQRFKTQAVRVVEKHLNTPEKERRPLFMALDSLGMLSTTKEMSDTESGKETKDMTRTQEIKAAFRVLTLKLSKAGIPLLVTNHVYQSVGSFFPTKEMSGGSGLKYAANNIITLGKAKEKAADGTVTGAIIRCKVMKSRLTREQIDARVLLSFDRGLDRYYGLIEFAITHGIFEKVSTKIKLPDGTLVFERAIIKNPTKFFTEDILKQLDVAIGSEFKFGSTIDTEDVVEKILLNE
jgi:RecA/RadA recombinase